MVGSNECICDLRVGSNDAFVVGGAAADLERCHFIVEGSPGEGRWVEGVFSRARQMAEREKEGMVSFGAGYPK